MSEDEELVQEFLAEGYENLDRLERELVAFEQHGASTEAIGAIFRTVHTIKGTAGFFGFEHLGHLTHIAENLLARIRDGQLTLTSDIVSALLQVSDACRAMLGVVASTGHDGADDHAALCARLTDLQGPAAPEPAEVAPVVVPAAVSVDPEPAPTPPPAPVAVPVAEPAEPAEPASARAPSDSNVRVDVGLLDKLMDLAGELVLARNQLLQFAAVSRDPSLVHAAQRLDLITSEMQEGVMKTRMQPIAGLWSKLPRVVRDLANELGKQVRLELEGQDTGLDRSILEAIKDPLTHIVRNSVDHGIETPAQRTAAGKPAEGVLRLRASHEGGHVMLEISDDGAGIDPERLRAKALERGLLTAERAARMSEPELLGMIFMAGFSTAAKVTNVSGRGVGMDVVKTNIAKIGGAVEVQSRLGAGTSIRIKIPLTLAIIPALIVTAGGERYAIPQSGVLELVRIDATAGRGVELIHGTPIYRRRGLLLPLVYLEAVLGGRPSPTASTIVVLHNEGRQLGLVVDSVQDTEEIVVKPVGKRLRDLATYAGATILGDGRVALILDVRGIASRSGLVASQASETVKVHEIDVAQDRRALLVVRLGGQHRVAVPLDDVARLEEFSAAKLERAGGVEVIQYRDRMLPLVRLGDSLGYGTDEVGSTLSVVVCRTGPTDLGLVVDSVVDIVEQAIEISRGFQRHGIFGSAVVDGRVTDLVDIATIASSANLGREAVS